MWKEATLDKIVLRAIAGIVRHTDIHADRVYHGLQVVLENVLACSVAPAAVYQQQNRIGVWVTLLANSVPIPLQTITSELGSVT